MGAIDRIAKAMLAGKPGGPHPGGIAVYHSSPYDFDKFDWSKLRTGEGANTYGAGFYFAENPAVSGRGGQYWDQFLHRAPPIERDAANMLKHHGFDRDAAADAVRTELERTKEVLARGAHPIESQITAIRQKHADTLQQRLDALTSGGPVGPRTYEVNINARPELMLDWDKPVSAQSPHVKDVLKNFGWEPDSYTMPGGALAPRIGGPQGQDVYRHLADAVPGKPQWKEHASNTLREAGIPGIRYLDAGSRNLEERLAQARAKYEQIGGPGYYTVMRKLEEKTPTYNYVVADPSKLDIMAKYGVVGGAPVGMGALAAQDQYGAQQ